MDLHQCQGTVQQMPRTRINIQFSSGGKGFCLAASNLRSGLCNELCVTALVIDPGNLSINNYFLKNVFRNLLIFAGLKRLNPVNTAFLKGFSARVLLYLSK